jgi:HAD superfamily hydrolase (TIGR01549 family)
MTPTFTRQFIEILKNKEIQIVSFDIFDTLVARSVAQPTDLFEIMGNIPFILERFDSPLNFKNIRIQAEKSARECCKQEEVTLTQIYEQLHYLTHREKQKLLKLELKTEKQTLFVNKEIEQLLKIAHAHDKKILLLSDMYLSLKQIEQIILKKLKYKEFIADTLVSSELQKTKHYGSMYAYLLKTYSLAPKNMLHIGDNPHSDIHMARQKGIQTLHYAPRTFLQEQFKNEHHYLHKNCGSLDTVRKISALLDPHSQQDESFFYNFGATVMGPVLWKFSHWLVDICEKNGISHIYSLSREGYILNSTVKKILQTKKVKKNLHLDVIQASRRSLFLPALTHRDLDFKNFDFSGFRHLSIADFYDFYGLTIDNENIARQSDLLLSKIYKEEAYDTLLTEILEDLASKKKQILKNADEKKALFLDYIKPFCHNKSILLDFGANASMHGMLQTLLGESYKFIDVLLYRTKRGFANSITKKQYTFFQSDEKTAYKTTLLRRSPDIFEILLNGTYPTVLDYKKSGKKSVAVLDAHPALLCKTTAKAFHKGIDSFFQTARRYKLSPDALQPDTIFDLMLRTVDLPTQHEAHYFGNLYLNKSDDNSVHTPLITDTNKEEIKKLGVSLAVKNLHLNPWYRWHDIPWIQGCITKIEPNFLKNTQFFQNEPYIKELDSILEQLVLHNISSVCIYGRGAFFEIIYEALQARSININFIVETVPSISIYYDIAILEPQQAVAKGEKNFIIASLSYKNEIKKTLQQFSKELTIIAPLE